MKKFKVEIIFLIITIFATFAANTGSVKGYNKRNSPRANYPYPTPYPTPYPYPYQIKESKVLLSIAKDDGYIRESTETSNVGGAMDANSKKIFLGDDAANRQYRGILSFDTSKLRDDAFITSVTLRFKYADKFGSPFYSLGNLIVDIRKGSFSSNPSLQLNDFKAIANSTSALSYNRSTTNGWYSQSLGRSDFQYINLTNVTQFKIRFTKDDNNNFKTDYLRIYSGNNTAGIVPELIVDYYFYSR